ncbi:hypothetical protein BDV29DRAFT_85375 [Aspergillus leporis]|uniref:C2H2-type domain-containing protein n=1 Tax=Aspergillus leporis TaxID=41062 RepID=A0A5N5WIM5_9EURO|nr:hypothetical protein BDV29DRAFT_85375 [Aspergillus leporis]
MQQSRRMLQVALTWYPCLLSRASSVRLTTLFSDGTTVTSNLASPLSCGSSDANHGGTKPIRKGMTVTVITTIVGNCVHHHGAYECYDCTAAFRTDCAFNHRDRYDSGRSPSKSQ